MRLTVNKTAVLGAVFILAMIMGWFDAGQLRGGQQEATLLEIHAVLSALLAFLWFRQDALERAFHPSWLLQIGVLLLSVLALPWYFFRSRGAAGGTKAVALLVAAFVVTMLCYRAGTWFN